MTDWTGGYVADIGYTFGYYQELNPLRSSLAFLRAGLAPPAQGTHCELGFGQGLSVNIHAAASGATWFGCDFNPAQAGFAQSLAKASGSGAHLTDEAFADFCTRADLPDFESIGLHGIWSWINDDNRAVIVDFLRRKLKVGGVLYISYNTQPGWAAMVPMRELLSQHAQIMGAAGQGITNRVDGALEFADKLLATNPRFLKANPHLGERLKRLKSQNRNYLAHEYFNRDWLPMPFSSMAQWLRPAKLDFACSAFYTDHVDALNLSAEQIAFLKDIPDQVFRETVRDFMVNQVFRKDYWVKGARQLNVSERAQALRAQQVMLIQPRVDVSLKMTGAVGEATMQGEVYNPILDALANHQPQTLGQIEQAVKAKGVSFPQLIEAVLILTGSGSLAAVQDASATTQAKPHTDRLNATLMDKARGGNGVQTLASPVTGGGLTVARFEQLFLIAMGQGLKTPQEWAQSAWQTLLTQGQKLVNEGKTLDSAEDNLAELTRQAQSFEAKKLPLMRALLIG